MLGNLHVKPHYPSFYPNINKTEWLYVCQWCFKYTHEIMKYSAHCVRVSHVVSLRCSLIEASKKVCAMKDEAPPGDLIYEKDGFAIRQLDGEEHKVRFVNTRLKTCC